MLTQNYQLIFYTPVHSTWAETDQKGQQICTVSEFRVLPGTLVLNQPIPDSVFSLTVQQGTRVDDFRRDDTDKITFFANQTGKLDLPTVETKSLDDIEWLTPQEVARPQELYPIEKATISWTQIVLTSAGIIMIILGLILRFYKTRNHS